MIQRIQSLYMLVAFALGVACLSLPLGYFCTAEGERVSDLFNLWMRSVEDGAISFTPWALFAILLTTTTLTFIDIFLFTRRALQMRILVVCILLLVGYYVYLGFCIYIAHANGYDFTPRVSAAFPFVGIVLDYLAFRAILKDELLVRSLDRLR